jgi:PHP family Zn ribbon phosphoesterase
MVGGVRPQKKLTQGQLTSGLQETNNRLHLLSSMIGQDMQRVNVLLFALLKELGKADEIECKKCETLNIRPILEEIEIEEICANCGERIVPLPESAFTGEMIDDSEE